ncbi:hypothetical protein N7462_006252, partial [Penicillium macrosclerotiorum]|uniref:uncharacterized protein n=1 Tax=Penicillium macrosclerotiorum TaxID=303699 RepID=UPI002547B6AC
MPPFQFRGNGPSRDRRSKPEFTFRVPHSTSARPLLRSDKEKTPELLAPESGDKPALKFASLDALSDSEEAEMDFSDDSDDESRPRKRRAVALDGNNDDVKPSPVPASAPATTPPPPKWSNPDPYTALPPPDESQHKRVDVVKLIRKARLANTQAQSNEKDAVANNHDFISLGSLSAFEASGSAVAARKRTRDDEPKPLTPKTGKPMRRFNHDGSILGEWRALKNQDPTPWISAVHNLNVSSRLHNEIIAFYNWVRPHHYEQVVRSDLVERVENAFRSRYSHVQVHAFGSFASGMYLPTADIDLVLLSTSFMRSGIKAFGERKGQIYAFAGFIKTSGLAVNGSVECIAHARVPILKWVDKLTGIRVDLSFDNDSGLLANRTFQAWKEQFPVMPVVVSIIKQFLLLRGLNEVPTGGLGGFSITCIVTSLLQHLPHGKDANLGSLLLDFFNFYGRTFDYEKTGLRMNPPGYFNKFFQVFENKDRLSIEDPNNPDNDISGGTKEIALIFRTFREAHFNLTRRMEYMSTTNNLNVSILESIIAANYDEYIEERFQLKHVYETAPQFAKYRVPPLRLLQEETRLRLFLRARLPGDLQNLLVLNCRTCLCLMIPTNSLLKIPPVQFDQFFSIPLGVVFIVLGEKVCIAAALMAGCLFFFCLCDPAARVPGSSSLFLLPCSMI